MTANEAEDSFREKLERIWTDKTPDHLDPAVKRYWRWVGFIMWHLWVLPFLLPVVFTLGAGQSTCIVSYILFLIVGGAFLLIYTNLLYESYTFLLLDDMVIIEKGVIWKKKNAIPYNRVQNVNITNNPLERILGIATVHIHTAGMGMAYAEGKLPGIPFPDELSEIILRKVRAFKYGSGLEDDVLMRDAEQFLNKFRQYLMEKERPR
jgi:membrane protein YdbS with pleckstrin-like domain